MTTIRKVGRTRLPKAQLRVLKAAKKARDKKLHWWFLAYYHDMDLAETYRTWLRQKRSRCE